MALAILGITLIAVFGAMRTCAGASHHARCVTRSVLLAETLLSDARNSETLAFETREGHEGLYRWQVRIASTPVENLGAVHVEVMWQEQQRQQKYELFSLIRMDSSASYE